MLRNMTRAPLAASAASSETISTAGSRQAEEGALPSPAQMRRMSASRLLVMHVASALTQWPALPDAAEGAANVDTIPPEAVHQLRITIRRLRALIDVYSPWIKPRWHRQLVTELQWLGHSMGPVRDADVLTTETLPALRLEYPDVDWIAVDAHLSKVRSDARAQAAAALTSERQRALHRLLRDAFGVHDNGRADARAAKALRRPSRTPGKRPRALAKHAHNVLRERYIGLFPDCRQLAMLDTEQLHALRVQIKKARYSAEALTPWLRKSVRSPYHETLRTAQTLLGHINDAAVAQRALEDMPISTEHRETLTTRLDAIIVNATSRAAHALCQLPDAHRLERGMRKA